MRSRWYCIPLAIINLILLSGCQKGEQSSVQFTEEIGTNSGGHFQQNEAGEILYTSSLGGFEVVLPPGCEKVQVNTRDDPDSRDPNRFAMVYVYCDREGYPEEGCSVQVHFNLRDQFGGPPTPDVVMDWVKKVMSSFQVQMVAQRPIRRGPLEGIQVYCREANNPGEVWVEGLLFGEMVYVLAAWRAAGNLFELPEISRFFESFQLAGDSDFGGS
jgi:hypothetical protein